MNLTVNSRNVADVQIQGVHLRSIVGAYEIQFGLNVTIPLINPQNDYARQVSIIGASVHLRTNGHGPQPVGFARPETPFVFKQAEFQNQITPTLVLPLQACQLAAIERLRGAGDLDFDLLISGIGNDQNGNNPLHDHWVTHVSQSDWLNKLRGAGARDILLIEVPLPMLSGERVSSEIGVGLTRAEGLFRNGDYHACVSECRSVLQELGHQKFGKKDWASPLLDRLANGNNRNSMTEGEREAALWATLRHYVHLAHHSSSEGGVLHYSRPEAHLVLTMVALLVGHVRTA